MKILIAVTLLLMSTLPCVAPGATYEELYSIEKLTVNEKVPADGTSLTHVSKDAARVVIVDLKNNVQYLMRIDPVEKCGRVIICDDGATCDKANDAIFLNPMGDKIIYQYKKPSTLNPFPGGSTQPTIKMEDDNILVEYSNNQATFTFNYRTEPVVIAVGANGKIRIETSSFYCKVNVGTVTSVGPPGTAVEYLPTMTVPKTKYGSNPHEFDMEPLRTRKSDPNGRTYFGPLFRRESNQHVFKHSPLQECGEEDMKCEGFGEYELDTTALCPHAHDWMGFSRWTEPIEKTNKVKYNTTFFKHPIYRYYLARSTDNSCGKLQKKPYQIEIELNQVFDIVTLRDFHRCFGFALVFETAANDVDNTGLTLDPALTFEFYLPAMMFIAPDTEKVRALRIKRDDLKKIRLSFYTEGEDYAIVEYGFLNDNIPGVREHISLANNPIKKFESVTLFSEGYCEVRVLNANQQDKESEDLCMHLSGCDVLTLKK